MALPKVKIGDVFSLKLTDGIGLIQCVKETGEAESEKIRVLPGIFSVVNETTIRDAILSKELFFIELPLKYALRKKLIERVGNYQIPDGSECPKYFREEHIIRTDFLGWHIVDTETWHRRLVKELSPEEQMLSPWGMISIPDIVERIESNWTPLEWV